MNTVVSNSGISASHSQIADLLFPQPGIHLQKCHLAVGIIGTRDGAHLAVTLLDSSPLALADYSSRMLLMGGGTG